MQTNDEWYYSELLKALKKKEASEESYYQQIEVESPYIEPPRSIDNEKVNKQNERGIAVIDLYPCFRESLLS